MFSAYLTDFLFLCVKKVVNLPPLTLCCIVNVANLCGEYKDAPSGDTTLPLPPIHPSSFATCSMRQKTGRWASLSSSSSFPTYQINPITLVAGESRGYNCMNTAKFMVAIINAISRAHAFIVKNACQTLLSDYFVQSACQRRKKGEMIARR